jgi:glycosyltransferase involved in cell wall biosynthesis
LIRISHIIGTPIMGGVQIGIRLLSSHDNQKNIERNVICLYPQYENFNGIFDKENNIDVYYCVKFFKGPLFRPYHFWKKVRNLLGLITFPIRFYFLLKKIKPDILINSEPKLVLVQVLISKFMSIPYILSMEGEIKFGNYSIFNKYIFKNIFIISNHKSTIDKNFLKIRNIEINKNAEIPIISVVPDLIDFPLEKKYSENKIIQIGTIGRLTWEKNFQQIVEITKLINETTKLKFKISIIGSGSELSKLKKIISNNRLEKQIILLGGQSYLKTIQFLSELDIYIQTSVSEGGPRTVKEAMASFLPVITTNVGDVAEVIDDGVDGFISPINNSEYFAKILIRLLQLDKEERFQIGLKARTKILENYSMKEVYNKHLKLVRYLIKK